MIPTSLRNRTAEQFSHEAHKPGVQYGDKHDQDGNCNDRNQMDKAAALNKLRASIYGKTGQDKSDEQTPGISHKNRGRVEIIDKKPQKGPDVSSGKQQYGSRLDRRLGALPVPDNQKTPADKGDAC